MRQDIQRRLHMQSNPFGQASLMNIFAGNLRMAGIGFYRGDGSPSPSACAIQIVL